MMSWPGDEEGAMSGSAIRSLQALADLRTELARFASDGHEVLQQVEIEIARTLEMLERERWECEDLVRRRYALYRQAQAAARARLVALPGEDSRDPERAGVVEVARRAEVALREAETVLQGVHQRTQAVQQATAAYRQQARRLGQMFERELPAARMFLAQEITARQSPTAPGRIADSHFIDAAGRPITIRSWEEGAFIWLRAYDTKQGAVPARPSVGQAARADLLCEWPDGGVGLRLKLEGIETTPDYQRAGIAAHLLARIEATARRYGAAEIYGTIDSPHARAFWAHQVASGWRIVEDGASEQARKVL
jgi:GNAT superfamily N-acetyltransferase